MPKLDYMCIFISAYRYALAVNLCGIPCQKIIAIIKTFNSMSCLIFFSRYFLYCYKCYSFGIVESHDTPHTGQNINILQPLGMQVV